MVRRIETLWPEQGGRWQFFPHVMAVLNGDMKAVDEAFGNGKGGFLMFLWLFSLFICPFLCCKIGRLGSYYFVTLFLIQNNSGIETYITDCISLGFTWIRDAALLDHNWRQLNLIDSSIDIKPPDRSNSQWKHFCCRNHWIHNCLTYPHKSSSLENLISLEVHCSHDIWT